MTEAFPAYIQNCAVSLVVVHCPLLIFKIAENEERAQIWKQDSDAEAKSQTRGDGFKIQNR